MVLPSVNFKQQEDYARSVNTGCKRVYTKLAYTNSIKKTGVKKSNEMQKRSSNMVSVVEIEVNNCYCDA